MKKFKFLFVTVLFILNIGVGAHAASVSIDKSNDKELQALISETLPKFTQLTYSENGTELKCNLFLPEGYPGNDKYPLVIFIADGSTVGDDAETPLKQGYGGIIWAGNIEQAKRKCIVLVPQYPRRIIDDKTGTAAAQYISMTENLIRAVTEGFQVNSRRVYATGQSMGCMALMIIANKNPDMFAGELFVAGQGNLKDIEGLTKQKFFYIVAEGDILAYQAQRNLIEKFQEAKVPVSRTYEWNAKMNQEEFERAMTVILAGRPNANFVRFIKNTVLPDSGIDKRYASNNEYNIAHEYSFDVPYKIDSLREWLFSLARR